MREISIAVVDDQPVLVEGLVLVFRSSGDCTVVATGGGLQEALAIAEERRPDLLIVDLALSGSTLKAISTVASKHPEIKIIAFTAASSMDFAVSVLEAGARAYVSKTCSADELIRAARAVMAGETYVSQSLASGVIAALRQASVRKRALQALKLTVREEQIVQLLLLGKPNKEIAARLGISEKTVKHYMTILMQKLNVTNRVEAVIAAQKLDPRLTSRTPAHSADLSCWN